MVKPFILLFVAIFLVIQTHADQPTLFEEEVRIYNEIFGNKDATLRVIRPPGEPTNVTVNMYVRNILSVNEDTRIWKVQLTFRQQWTDSRLAFTSTHPDMKYVTITCPKHLWVPDLFFSNEVDSEHHDMTTPNNLIRIHPDGAVLYSTRVTLDLSCDADFKDKEVVCPIRIASYAYTHEEISLDWETENPVQLPKENFKYLPEHRFQGVKTSKCDSSTKTGTYGCIIADFTFKHGGVCHA